MKNAKNLFHYISYLQYPFMLIALYYAYKPFFYGFEFIWVYYNKVLLFMGLGISFSTLQDTTKTQNKLSKRVWENPKYAKMFLIYLALLIVFLISFGMFGIFVAKNEIIKELSFGTIVLSTGFIGLLKSAMEMAENNIKRA